MLLSELYHLLLHFLEIQLKSIFFCVSLRCSSGSKVFLFLLYLHGEEASNFDVFDDSTWNVELILGKLLDKLLQKSLVIFSYQLAEVFLNMNATGVADLETFNADLTLAERQDLHLLESTFNREACFHACDIHRHHIRQNTINILDLKLIKEHKPNRLCQLPNATQTLAQNNGLLFWIGLQHMVKQISQEFFNFIVESVCC